MRVTREHNEDCKRLLRLMGVPVVEAPGEAEAQCAQLCKDNAVYAISTEDMDSLTFGTPRLLRHLMAPASQKTAVVEFEYEKVLEELKLTREQFVDLCILCGCDYTDKIGGIGPVRAVSLIQKHGSLEEVLASLDPAKYKVRLLLGFKLIKGTWEMLVSSLASVVGAAFFWCTRGWPTAPPFLRGDESRSLNYFHLAQ